MPDEFAGVPSAFVEHRLLACTGDGERGVRTLLHYAPGRVRFMMAHAPRDDGLCHLLVGVHLAQRMLRLGFASPCGADADDRSRPG